MLTALTQLEAQYKSTSSSRSTIAETTWGGEDKWVYDDAKWKELGDLGLIDGLRGIDKSEQVLRIYRTSESSDMTAKTTLNIGTKNAFLGTAQDLDWVDDVLAKFEPVLASNCSAKLLQCSGWDTLRGALKVHAEYQLHEENHEVPVSFWVNHDLVVLTNLIMKLLNISPDTVCYAEHLDAVSESKEFLKGNRASWVTREVLFQLGPRECHPALRKAVLRRELNSIATVLADALTLGGLGCCHSSDWDNTDRGIGMYYQAYTAGCDDDSQLHCDVVWMGHPALYRIAYIDQQQLVLSGWRSSHPEKIRAHLIEEHGSWPEVSQVHFVLENLAMANLLDSPERLKQFIQDRSARRPVMSVRAQMCHYVSDIYGAFRSIYQDSIRLAHDEVFGMFRVNSAISGTGPMEFPTVLKSHRVWRNESMVAKYVTEGEIKALSALEGIRGVPSLHSTFIVKTGPYTGEAFVIVPYLGEPVTEEGLESDPTTSNAIFTIVSELHGHGWHHHDISARNVVRGPDGQVYLIDYDLAEKASECKSSCPDIGFFPFLDQPSFFAAHNTATTSPTCFQSYRILTSESDETSALVQDDHDLSACRSSNESSPDYLATASLHHCPSPAHSNDT